MVDAYEFGVGIHDEVIVGLQQLVHLATEPSLVSPLHDVCAAAAAARARTAPLATLRSHQSAILSASGFHNLILLSAESAPPAGTPEAEAVQKWKRAVNKKLKQIAELWF